MTDEPTRIGWTNPRVRGLLDALGLEAGRSAIAAIGWATVDLDRAATDLGGDWLPAPDDRLLGASVRHATTNEPHILLLEPNTEGRLAGALARQGEGPIALYLRGASGGAGEPSKTRLGSGPFGPERLVLEGSPAGPFLILIETADPARQDTDRVPSEP